MRTGPWKSRHRIARASALGAVLALVVALAPGAGSQELTPVPWAEADFGGAATGTVFHAHTLEFDGERAENTDVAFSGATVDSDGLVQRRVNEMDREYQASKPDKVSHARGSGLEIGLGVTAEDPNQVIVAGLAEADAPPDSHEREEIGPVPAEPLAWATVARGDALARWNDDMCILGDDISRGLGYASDVQLIETNGDGEGDGMDAPLVALDHPDPERAVSQSLSRNILVAQAAGDGFGLASQVRQTIAPLTLFQGTENQFTIEFLGEWVLTAVATGLPGGAVIHYGPGEVSPETPILRLIDAEEAETLLSFQDIFGDEGLTVELPGGLAQIVLGEAPREVTESPDGTFASGKVDVLRVSLLDDLDPGFQLAEVRVGHMEVEARVPVGGIGCELPVQKHADPPAVAVNETFVTPITVINPFDCDLTQVRVEDHITTIQGARFEVVGTDPQADQVPVGVQTVGTVVWNDIGTIPIGESATVTVTIRADAPGEIHDIATATAVLANCRGHDVAVEGVAIALAGAAVSGVSPEVRVPVGAVLGAQLARTGAGPAQAAAGGLILLALAGGGYLLSRRVYG